MLPQVQYIQLIFDLYCAYRVSAWHGISIKLGMPYYCSPSRMTYRQVYLMTTER